MAKQLELDMGDTDLYPMHTLINNFLEVGLEPQMVPAIANKNNRIQVKGFAKSRKARFSLPLRAQPYFESRNSYSLKSLGLQGLPLYHFGNFFDIDDGKESNSWVQTIGVTESHLSSSDRYVLDGIEIQNVDNTVTVTMLMTQRVMPEKKKTANSWSTRFPNTERPSMTKCNIQRRMILCLSYTKVNEDLALNNTSYFQVLNDKVVTNYSIKEKVPGSGLPFLYNFFCGEKMKSFFNATNLSKSLKKHMIDGVANVMADTLMKLYPTTNTIGYVEYLDSLIFNKAVDVPLLKDMFPHPMVLRPLFVNGLHYTGDFSPFHNPYKEVSFITMLTEKIAETDNVTLINKFYPNCKWAVKKTVEFWRTQMAFFCEDGYFNPETVKIAIDMLREVHRFYCIYNHLFSNDLDRVDKDFSPYYLRLLVYDYDLATKVNGLDRVTGLNGRCSNVIPNFYKVTSRIGEHLSIEKRRRMFNEFFQPFDVFNPSNNKHMTADGHIYETLLTHWAYMMDFNLILDSAEENELTKDNWVGEMRWTKFTRLKDVHDVLDRYMQRFKHAGKVCTNPIYTKLRDNPNIPNSTMQIKVATSTGEVKTWGQEQSHCLANYADQINMDDKLLFGIWDTATNTWFGHCTMYTNTKVPDHANSWNVNQFLGKSNIAIDANKKAQVISHVMDVLYPPDSTPEQATAPDEKVKEYA